MAEAHERRQIQPPLRQHQPGALSHHEITYVWEVERRSVVGRDTRVATALLAAGWEPFAVDAGMIYFRRRVPAGLTEVQG
jgi:hypothetical protein